MKHFFNPCQSRKESIFHLGSAETKLLYTLHWILLDAMDECCLEDAEKGKKTDQDFNFPISSITVSCKAIRCQYWKTKCCRHLYICLPLFVTSYGRQILIRTWGWSMERRSGVQCGIIGTQTWTASHLRLVRSYENYHYLKIHCNLHRLNQKKQLWKMFRKR